MSLLNIQPRVEIPQAISAADSIRRNARIITDKLLKSLNAGLDDIWKSEDPAAVLAALGTDAAEAFLLSSETTKFLAVVLATSRSEDLAALLAKVAEIPAFTVNPDGTVTLD
jgi:hypothetical protein